MKTITSIIVLLFIQFTFSQRMYEPDSAKAISYIKDKLVKLKKQDVAQTIFLFDSSGKIILIWEKEKKYKALKSLYKGGEIPKFRVSRLSKKNKSDIAVIFSNPDLINLLKDSNCDTNVYNITKISIGISNTKYFSNFSSNCKQVEELEPIIALYYSLLR